MNKQALSAIGAMLNSFPQGATNPDLLIRTYEASLSGIADDIVVEIAKRFTTGSVNEQSLTFAPSVAEFSKACRDLVEVRLASRAIPFRQEAIARDPIEIRHARVRNQFADRAIIADGIDHNEFVRRARLKEWPDGCEYVAQIGTVFARAE